jgi:hypothetical protein
MRLIASGAAALLTLSCAFAAPAFAATTLNAGVSGTITTSEPTPIPGVQTFTLSGGFTYYNASSNLPQITGGDLDQYSFSVTGTSVSYDDLTRTVIYGNVTGTIMGYGQVVQTLAPTQLIVAFDPTFATATVLGTLQSTGPVTPQGFPGPIDFTPANGAVIAGTYTSFGIPGGGGSFNGTIILADATAVPEPATWGLMILGAGMAGGAARRRRAVRVTYA